MKKVLTLTFASLAISMSTAAIAGGDVAAGKTKSATCAACHGMDGNSVNPIWPKLAGQHENYIVKQLANFKEKKRNDPTMSPQATNLSEQDMADLAAYYASQTTAAGEADQTKVSLGQQIYKGGNNASGVAACASCHGAQGEGIESANFPQLSGQHVDYLKKQLEMFRKGERTNDAGKMMQNIAEKMTDEEIDAVSEYISGLK